MKREAECGHRVDEMKLPKGFQPVHFVRGDPLETVPKDGIALGHNTDDTKKNLKRGEL